MVEIGEDHVDVCVGGEASFRVFVHGACEVFNSHLGGFVLNGGKS